MQNGKTILKRGYIMDALKNVKSIKVNFPMLRQVRAKTDSIIFLEHALLFIDRI